MRFRWEFCEVGTMKWHTVCLFVFVFDEKRFSFFFEELDHLHDDDESLFVNFFSLLEGRKYC